MLQPAITITSGAIKTITINVTSTILAMSGQTGISIRIESNDTMAAGYAKAISKDGCAGTENCPVLTCTYEQDFTLVFIGIILAVGVVALILIIKKKRGTRVAAPAPAKVIPATKETPEPQETITPQAPPGPEEPKF